MYEKCLKQKQILLDVFMAVYMICKKQRDQGSWYGIIAWLKGITTQLAM